LIPIQYIQGRDVNAVVQFKKSTLFRLRLGLRSPSCITIHLQ